MGLTLKKDRPSKMSVWFVVLLAVGFAGCGGAPAENTARTVEPVISAEALAEMKEATIVDFQVPIVVRWAKTDSVFVASVKIQDIDGDKFHTKTVRVTREKKTLVYTYATENFEDENSLFDFNVNPVQSSEISVEWPTFQDWLYYTHASYHSVCLSSELRKRSLAITPDMLGPALIGLHDDFADSERVVWLAIDMKPENYYQSKRASIADEFVQAERVSWTVGRHHRLAVLDVEYPRYGEVRVRNLISGSPSIALSGQTGFESGCLRERNKFVRTYQIATKEDDDAASYSIDKLLDPKALLKPLPIEIMTSASSDNSPFYSLGITPGEIKATIYKFKIGSVAADKYENDLKSARGEN
ncbi:MAG: hypothetical protein RBT63_00965 [Bdellovibrionales bacterium]|jgi:hypothetical protein|nr:hypothetical protein [Bdellovibrionales bacterium]